jgi:hypothetical protein
MKQFNLTTVKKGMLLFLFSIIGLMSFAQDSGATTSTTTSTNSNKTTTSVFVEPWVWVVGGIILLLILIGLFRKGSSTRVEKNTTVIDRDR